MPSCPILCLILCPCTSPPQTFPPTPLLQVVCDQLKQKVYELYNV